MSTTGSGTMKAGQRLYEAWLVRQPEHSALVWSELQAMEKKFWKDVAADLIAAYDKGEIL